MIKYPASIDTSIELPTVVDNVTPINGALLNNIRDAILAVENELGIKPSGIYTNVRTRITALEVTVGNIVTASVSFGGDLLSINSTHQHVIGLQGNLVSSTTPTDGYVLTWDNVDGYWLPKPLRIPQEEIVFVAGDQTTILTTFTRAGGRKVDLTSFPSSIGALTRRIEFIVDVQKTSGATSVEVELFDITNVIQVTSTNIVYNSSNNLTEISSGALTVGSSSGNVRNDISTAYEVHFKMNGGTPTDQVFITNARLLISYV